MEFHKSKLYFDVDEEGEDKYIACSKPACYYCHLYIRHHPLQVVVPETYRKVYLNWGPEKLHGSAKDPGWLE